MRLYQGYCSSSSSSSITMSKSCYVLLSFLRVFLSFFLFRISEQPSRRTTSCWSRWGPACLPRKIRRPSSWWSAATSIRPSAPRALLFLGPSMQGLQAARSKSCPDYACLLRRCMHVFQSWEKGILALQVFYMYVKAKHLGPYMFSGATSTVSVLWTSSTCM